MSPTPPNDPTAAAVHGTSTITPVGKKGIPWLIWLLPLLLVIAGLAFALRSCGRPDESVMVIQPAPVAVDGGTPPVAIKQVVLPNGASLELEPTSLNYLLQAFLASSEAVPRTFVFDRLNFATASAELPADAQVTVDALAEILKAYPAARVRLDGYADARGSEPANAQLGTRRAEAVAAALTSRGIAADRVTTATGGETNPVDTNATPQGRAENRRTELVVLSK